MDIPAKYKEIDVFKEGTLLGLFFILIGVLFLIINLFFPSNWIVLFGVLILALGLVIFLMAIFIPFISKKKSDVLLFAWNEFLYLFLGLPIAAICILIVPFSIYILFFSGDVIIAGMFSLYFVLSLQLSSMLHTGLQIWLHRRSSGRTIPVKIDKGPIEQLLYRIPVSED